MWHDVWSFSGVTKRKSGASCVAPGKSSLHWSSKGERGIALEPQQGNKASRHVRGGIWRSFLSCSRKPWVPSTCDSDFSELLMMPVGIQEYCGFGSGLSGLHWGRCNGRGPHLELRREPQDSFPVLTWVSGCVCHFKQGVRSRLVWGMESAILSSCKGVSGLQES